MSLPIQRLANGSNWPAGKGLSALISSFLGS